MNLLAAAIVLGACLMALRMYEIITTYKEKTCRKCGGECEEKFNNANPAWVCKECRIISHYVKREK